VTNPKTRPHASMSMLIVSDRHSRGVEFIRQVRMRAIGSGPDDGIKCLHPYNKVRCATCDVGRSRRRLQMFEQSRPRRRAAFHHALRTGRSNASRRIEMMLSAGFRGAHQGKLLADPQFVQGMIAGFHRELEQSGLPARDQDRVSIDN